jgi:hypothetical protein
LAYHREDRIDDPHRLNVGIVPPHVGDTRLTWPNGTHDRHAGLLCDTAAYRKHGTRRRSQHFSNFGGKNHKYAKPCLVALDDRRTHRVYEPQDFPRPAASPSLPAVRAPRLRADRVERARRYVAAVPPAIAGHHGDASTFRICCRLARGFALSDAEALGILRDWNARCVPPWTDRELVDRLKSARRYGREPLGGLLEEAIT